MLEHRSALGCANEPGVNCRAVLSSYEVDFARFSSLNFFFLSNS